MSDTNHSKNVRNWHRAGLDPCLFPKKRLVSYSNQEKLIMYKITLKGYTSEEDLIYSEEEFYQSYAGAESRGKEWIAGRKYRDYKIESVEVK